MVDIYKLKDLKIGEPIIPTFLEYTENNSIIFEFPDIVEEFFNDRLDVNIERSYSSIEEFCEDLSMDKDEFGEMYWIDEDLTNKVREIYPTIINVWCANG